MEEKILDAIDEATKWIDLEGVVGIGEGKKNKKKCIKVHVSIPTTEFSSIIPNTFKGFPVVIEETGEFSLESKKLKIKRKK